MSMAKSLQNMVKKNPVKIALAKETVKKTVMPAYRGIMKNCAPKKTAVKKFPGFTENSKTCKISARPGGQVCSCQNCQSGKPVKGVSNQGLRENCRHKENSVKKAPLHMGTSKQ